MTRFIRVQFLPFLTFSMHLDKPWKFLYFHYPDEILRPCRSKSKQSFKTVTDHISYKAYFKRLLNRSFWRARNIKYQFEVAALVLRHECVKALWSTEQTWKRRRSAFKVFKRIAFCRGRRNQKSRLIGKAVRLGVEADLEPEKELRT